MTADEAGEATLNAISCTLKEIDRKITKRTNKGRSALVYINPILALDQKEFIARHYSTLGFETDWSLKYKIIFIW